MMNNYDDIKHLTRTQYDDLHPMSMHDRATAGKGMLLSVLSREQLCYIKTP